MDKKTLDDLPVEKLRLQVLQTGAKAARLRRQAAQKATQADEAAAAYQELRAYAEERGVSIEPAKTEEPA